jgi:hypothetical protein
MSRTVSGAATGKNTAVCPRGPEMPASKPPLMITTCSAGKRCRTALHIEAIPRGTQHAIGTAWLERLRAERDLTPARQLYKGRAFRLARDTAEEINADLGIISAGLGYVRGSTEIPGYDVTVRPSGPGSVFKRIQGHFDARAWWNVVNAGPFSADLVEDARGRPLILVCLSRAYAEMVAPDLAANLPIETLRIFGLSLESALPSELRQAVMPYDERLQALGAPGTRVDFPQRALRDFVQYVWPNSDGTLTGDRHTVAERISPGKLPERLGNRRRVDDADLRSTILRLLPTVGSSGSRLLAHVRHVERISCEQARFARVLRQLKAELRL